MSGNTRRSPHERIKDAGAEFLAGKRVVVTGVSRQAKDHGSNIVYKRLREHGPRGRPADQHPTPLGHTNLGITSIYLQGIDSAEIIDTVHARRPPVVSVRSTLRL